MELISEKTDFVGLNYYSRERAKANPFIPFVGADISGKEPRDLPESDTRTAMGWEVYHEGLTEILTALRNEYGNPPVYITEFGSAWTDTPIVSSSGSEVRDARRVTYLQQQVKGMLKALEAGSNLKGCFVWSFLDNFEWAEGFSKRFGLIHVDYATKKRIVKDSGKWFAELIRTRSLTTEGDHP